MRLSPLLAAALTFTPVAAFAETASGPAAQVAAPAASCPLEVQASLEQEQARVDFRLARIDSERDRLRLTGPIIGLGLSAGSIAVLGMLMSAYDEQLRLIGSLTALPLAGMVTNSVLLGTRLRKRHRLNVERDRLRRRSTYLDSQRMLVSRAECPDLAEAEKEARADLARLDAEIALLNDALSELSYTGPSLVMAAGGVAALSLLTTSFLFWVGGAVSEYPEEDYGPEEKRRVRGLLGGGIAALGVIAAGGVWLRLRHRQRAPLGISMRNLVERRRGVEAAIAPQIGTTSFGLLLSARF